MKIDNNVKILIKQAIREDIASGDITTRVLIPANAQAKAAIIAKQGGIIAGLDVAKEVFAQLDKNLRFKLCVGDGDRVKKGAIVAKISGSVKAILTAERTALNFLGHLSGIATLTRQFVDEIRPYKAKILDTRKTTPGLRALEKYAVKCGGGHNHRMGLWDGVLIKDNHMSVVRKKNGMEEIIEQIRKKISKKIPIEIEVINLAQLRDVLKAGPDVIMLDNMALPWIRKAVVVRDKFLRNTEYGRRTTVLLEVSGRVTLNNVRQIARTGIDRISIGSLTHSAKPLDLSLSIR